MKHIIIHAISLMKLVTRLVLFIFFGALWLFMAPFMLLLSFVAIVLAWATNTRSVTGCAKEDFLGVLSSLNPFRIIFKH